MSIRLKLIAAYLLISLSSLLLTNLLSYSHERKVLTRQIFNHLESVASIQQNRIKGIIGRNFERLGLVASRTQMRISLKQFNIDGKHEHQIKLNGLLNDSKASVADFKKISLFALDGTVIASTDSNIIGENYSEKPFFVRGMKEFSVDQFSLDENNEIILFLSGPVYLHDKLIGVLVIESTAENILNAISDYTGLGETGETILAGRNESGDAILLMPTRFDPNAALRLTIPKISPERSMNQIFLGIYDIVTDDIDYRGVSVLAATRHVEETDWGIVVKIDKAEAFAPIIEMRNLLLIGIGFSVLVIIMLSLYFAKSITEPIIRLTNTAKTISKGTAVRADEASRDEIGILARTFNKMTDNLINAQQVLRNNIDELQESEERIRLLLDSTGEAIYGLDKNGNCTFCNPACLRLLGYEGEHDLLGQNMHTLIHHTKPDGEEYPPGECRIIQGLQRKEGVYVDNEVFWRADGTSFWVEYRSYPVIKDHKFMNAVVTFVDISERKAAEEEREKLSAQLQQAQKLEAVGTLAAGVAHDFNNILSAILGYGELAQLKLPQGSEAEADLEKVLAAGNRAKDLVKQILTFSRQRRQERLPLQLHLIAKEALKLLRASIPTTIEIRERIDSKSGIVLADPTQIHQVLMNLCTNAYQAMRETGGVLAVELSRVIISKDDNKVAGFQLAPGPYVKLEVSDTGHGMERAVMERMFEPYFTTKKKGEGTGMGLALVHGIVKDHGGHITVYSEPGRGTTVHVYLPRLDAATVKVEAGEVEALPCGNESILVVDDEQIVVEMEQRMLEDLGYQVTAMTDCVKAFKAFEHDPENFDLVITDMTMPHMTGAVLAQKILEIRPEVPIVLCTGFSELIDEEKAKVIGIQEYVMKPIVIRDMAGIVRKLLDKRKSG